MSDDKQQGFFAHERTLVDAADATLRVPGGGAAADAQRLVQSLLALPLPQREALRLRHVEHWPLEQIAAEMRSTELDVTRLLLAGARQLQSSIPQRQE